MPVGSIERERERRTNTDCERERVRERGRGRCRQAVEVFCFRRRRRRSERWTTKTCGWSKRAQVEVLAGTSNKVAIVCITVTGQPRYGAAAGGESTVKGSVTVVMFR